MNSRPKTDRWTFAWLILVLGSGLAARFWSGTFGHNGDFDSYRIVADLLAEGKNVYAGTARYNYGPVWFNVVHGLDWLAGHDPARFRWLLIGLLSAADVGIFCVLWKKFGRLAAALFFLNPVSIMITGYHNMFDNLAVLLGLWAVLRFGDDFEKPLDRQKFSGLLLLGLSLMTKHLLFLFPFWLAVKQRGTLQKFFILLVPTAVFLAGFLPYWDAGHAGIVRDVFQYQSATATSAYFYNLLVPEFFKYFGGPAAWWILFLAWFAFLCRAKNSLTSLLVYTGVLVAASPATSNQYLAIPLALACVDLNLFFIGYLALAAVHIALDAEGPHLLEGRHERYDDFAVLCLFFALVWMIWRQKIIHALQNCRQEICRQLGRGP